MTRSDRYQRTQSGRSKDRRWKVGTGVMLLLGLFAGLVGIAPSAFAHHAYLQGNVASVCDAPTGKIKVTFEVRSWSTVSSGERVLNSSIGIQYRLGNTNSFPAITSPVSGFSADVTTGAFTNNNAGGIPSFTGSFLVDASNAGKYIQLRSYPKGNWTNLAGTSSLAPNPETDDSFVIAIDPLQSGCTPATPSATAQVVCAANKITVSFTGVGAATTVDVTKNGSPVAGGTGLSVPVGPSTFDVPLGAADENTTVTIGLNYAAASATDQSLQVPVDCKTPPAPSADVQWACESNATVVLGNTGQETIQATILKNGSPVFSNIDVPPGGTNRTVTMGGADENTLVTIKVTFSDAGTATDVTEAFTVDCDKPAPTIGTPVCADGGLNVVLGNVQGTDTATFTIVIGGAETTETVPAGGTKTVLIPVAEDATVSVSITSGDQSYLNQALKRDCQKPGASLSFSCAEGGVVVDLTNTGTEATVINVGGTDHTVAANGTKQVTVPVAEGASYSVTVTGGDGLNKTLSGTRDCEEPAALLTFSCAEGGVVVTLTNTGEQATSVLVNGTPTNVPAGGSPVVVKIPVAEGASYNVTVTGDGLDESISGTRDCEKPAVQSMSLDCAEGGVVVVLTNTGELPATVTVDGKSVQIPADGQTSVTVPVAENDTYDFDIVIDGGTTNVAGTRDCEQPAVVSATLECAEGGVLVVLTNSGERDTSVVVDGVEVNVPAGTTTADPVTVLVPVDENAAYDFTVTGDELDERYTGTRDCERPAIESVSFECAEGGVVVVLTNDGEADTTVLVDGVEVLVPAGTTAEAPVTVLVPVDENAAYDVTVVGDGIEQQLTGTADCLMLEPSVDIVCAAGGLRAVLDNAGDDLATFVLTSPALPDGEVTVTVEAGGTESVHLPLAEEASTDLEVTSGDEVLFDDTITRDCETVEGEISRPPLPRTGADTNGLLATAGALLLAGAALVAGGRRRGAQLLP